MSFIGNKPDSFQYASTTSSQYSGDGVTTAFTLTRQVSANSDIQVVVNNVQQEPGVAYYVTNLTNLIFTGVPSAGTNNIYVVYRNYVQSGVAPGANTVTTSAIAANTIQAWQLSNSLLNPTVNSFTGNGANTAFTLTYTPPSANAVTVTVNGITQSFPANYSTSGTTLTFTSAPANGSVIRAVQQAVLGTSIIPIDGSVTTQKLGQINTINGGGAALNLQTNATTRVSLTAAGYLLVGSTSASGANLLQVNSDALINGLTVGKGGGAVANSTVVGNGALASNSTGNYNSAFGFQSLASNTTASNNTAVGYQAGYSNVTGARLTALGVFAGYSNTTDSNTLIGGYSGYATTSGTENSALGDTSLRLNTTGSYNVAVGKSALFSNTTASNNTAVGYQAGFANTTAVNGTYLGYQAGYTNTTGSTNTFIGNGAGYFSTSGSNTFVGNGAGYTVSTGSGNTFLGGGVYGSVYASGYFMTTGSKNTIIGNYSGNQGGLDIRTASNYIVLSDGDGNPQATMYQGGSLALSGATPKAGTGITFPATQSASSDANTLDDYEEGTWTPTITTDGTPATVTYLAQYGVYTKIGRQVTVYGRLQLASKSGGTGNVVISNLPFSFISAGGSASMGYVSNLTYGSGYTQITLYYNAASPTYISFARSGSALTADNVPIANVGTTFDVTFTATYFTS